MKFGRVVPCHICGDAALDGGYVSWRDENLILCNECTAYVMGCISKRRDDIAKSGGRR